VGRIPARHAVAILLLLLSLAVPSFGEDLPRFFFEGNGHLVLRHAYFDTTLDVRYRHADGSYDPAALRQIEHFFRSREDGREAPIPLRLIELLSYIQGHYHPRQMILLSGFRSPQFNADLRQAGGAVAQASLHTEAMAADITFTGLDMAHLWHQLRDLGTGGVGYYRANKFLHIDTGPPRFWEATTSRVSENLSADNARVFLRTDFDRYRDLRGAVCALHSVTAYPVMLSTHAKVAGADEASITIEPSNGASVNTDGCFAVSSPDAREFRVKSTSVTGGQSAMRGQSRVVLSTCEPRTGKTPAEITSNPIEIRQR
jgi:uncharacterized protein YcbK (DUF882 family)